MADVIQVVHVAIVTQIQDQIKLVDCAAQVAKEVIMVVKKGEAVFRQLGQRRVQGFKDAVIVRGPILIGISGIGLVQIAVNDGDVKNSGGHGIIRIMNTNVILSEEKIQNFCRRHRIRKLSLFGSLLRSDFRPDSDVDVLVEFEPEAHVTLFDMGAAQVELSEILGRVVDLKTAGFLSPYFRQQVINQAQLVYESR